MVLLLPVEKQRILKTLAATPKLPPKKQHIVKISAITLNKSKRKEKGFFFSFRFKTTSLDPRHVGRMSGALCDLGKT
jgi:hypothetical protein